MRRIVQRSVENIVAKLLLADQVKPGSTIEITREWVESTLGPKLQADDIMNEK
jgi:ATP-dependent Clp protease ATP-binding subunit ClpA